MWLRLSTAWPAAASGGEALYFQANQGDSFRRRRPEGSCGSYVPVRNCRMPRYLRRAVHPETRVRSRTARYRARGRCRSRAILVRPARLRPRPSHHGRERCQIPRHRAPRRYGMGVGQGADVRQRSTYAVRAPRSARAGALSGAPPVRGVHILLNTQQLIGRRNSA